MVMLSIVRPDASWASLRKVIARLARYIVPSLSAASSTMKCGLSKARKRII